MASADVRSLCGEFAKRQGIIEEPRSMRSTAERQNLRGMFCLTSVLRIDRKEICLNQIRSLTPQHAEHCHTAEPTGNALAVAVHFVPAEPRKKLNLTLKAISSFIAYSLWLSALSGRSLNAG